MVVPSPAFRCRDTNGYNPVRADTPRYQLSIFKGRAFRHADPAVPARAALQEDKNARCAVTSYRVFDACSRPRGVFRQTKACTQGAARGRLCHDGQCGGAGLHRTDRADRRDDRVRRPPAGRRHHPGAALRGRLAGPRRPAALPDRSQALSRRTRPGRRDARERARHLCRRTGAGRPLPHAERHPGGQQAADRQHDRLGARGAGHRPPGRGIAGNRADQPRLYDRARADFRTDQPLGGNPRCLGDGQPDDRTRDDLAARSDLCRYHAIERCADRAAPIARQGQRARFERDGASEVAGRFGLSAGRHARIRRGDGGRGSAAR